MNFEFSERDGETLHTFYSKQLLSGQVSAPRRWGNRARAYRFRNFDPQARQN